MTMPQYGNCPHKPGTWCIPCVAKAHDEWDAERKRSEAEIATLNADLAAARVAVAEAKRERDEWKLASSKNGDAMSGYQSRAIVAEHQLEGAKRERDAALASLAERQRAIDEAFATLDAGHGMLACREAAHILRHATKATEAQEKNDGH